jgi:hypothetical protein
MVILNPSFEFAPGALTPWEATGWTFTSSAATRIAGFGEYEDPLELFTWGGFVSDTSTFASAVFGPGTKLYEDFNFGSLIIDWAPGWVVSFIDAMEWYTFSDVFIAGVFWGWEGFEWTVFSDIFVPGLVCLFDAGTLPYEEFETW